MSRDEQERLRDIKDAIVAINAHLKRVNKAEPEMDDTLLHDALLFQFVVIGEAVKHLTRQTAKRPPRSLGPMSPASGTSSPMSTFGSISTASSTSSSTISRLLRKP